eukprot:13785361-Alexandrium_andersonii.AAC.1
MLQQQLLQQPRNNIQENGEDLVLCDLDFVKSETRLHSEVEGEPVLDAGPLCDLLWMDPETGSGVNDSDVQCFLRQHGAHLVGHARRVVEQSEE